MMQKARFPGIVPWFTALVLAIGIAHEASAQDASRVPAIRKELAAATDDTARADALARLCFNLIRTAPDSALAAGEAAMAIAKRIQNPKALGDAHNNLGWLAAEQGQYQRADSLLGEALTIFNKIGDPAYKAVTLSNLGWLEAKKGNDAAAVVRFQEAYRQSGAAQDSATMAGLLYALGSTNRKLKDYAKAKEYLTAALAMERALGRPGNEANCLLAMANTAREQGDPAQVMPLYAQAVMIYKRLRDHAGMGLVEENIGDFRMDGDPRQALAHYAIALAQYDSIASDADRAYVLKNMGIAQTKLGKLAEARTDLDRGQALARSVGAAQLVMEYELALAELASARGDAAATLGHYARYTAMKDSLQGADTQHEIARLRTQFETERKERDNALLRVENQAQQQQLHNRSLLLYASTLLALLAILAALLFRRNFQQKRRHTAVLEELNHKLAASNAEINEINGLLESKLLRSQMNPHFIYNGLNSAMRLAQAGHTPEAIGYLQGFARLLRMVLDHSVNETVPIGDELDFLRQYLQLESKRLEGLAYSVEAEPDLMEAEAELPALVVQPFVENAVWHGLTEKPGERRVHVRYVRNGDTIRCTITDNGKGRGIATGRKAGTEHRSLGMQLTDERLRLLSRRLGSGNEFEVEDLLDASGAAAGTRVTLHLRTMDQ
ncbi:MAG: tetratricopeptide repeat protein [Bacteroidetes bacterium]|nr:tetratricopeptide repeat protein [Bacteroidota bacterium]